MTHTRERSGAAENTGTARTSARATTIDPCGVGHRQAEARERLAMLATQDRSRNAAQVLGIPRVARAAPETSKKRRRDFGSTPPTSSPSTRSGRKR